MAKIYKCDRCGKCYDRNENVKYLNPRNLQQCFALVGIQVVDELENCVCEYDLCDDCMTAFKEFMKEE